MIFLFLNPFEEAVDQLVDSIVKEFQEGLEDEDPQLKSLVYEGFQPKEVIGDILGKHVRGILDLFLNDSRVGANGIPFHDQVIRLAETAAGEVCHELSEGFTDGFSGFKVYVAQALKTQMEKAMPGAGQMIRPEQQFLPFIERSYQRYTQARQPSRETQVTGTIQGTQQEVIEEVAKAIADDKEDEERVVVLELSDEYKKGSK